MNSHTRRARREEPQPLVIPYKLGARVEGHLSSREQKVNVTCDEEDWSDSSESDAPHLSSTVPQHQSSATATQSKSVSFSEVPKRRDFCRSSHTPKRSDSRSYSSARPAGEIYPMRDHFYTGPRGPHPVPQPPVDHYRRPQPPHAAADYTYDLAPPVVANYPYPSSYPSNPFASPFSQQPTLTPASPWNTNYDGTYYASQQPYQDYQETTTPPQSTRTSMPDAARQAKINTVMNGVEKIRRKLRRMEREKQDDQEVIAQLERNAQEREDQLFRETQHREANFASQMQQQRIAQDRILLELREEMNRKLSLMQQARQRTQQNNLDFEDMLQPQAEYTSMLRDPQFQSSQSPNQTVIDQSAELNDLQIQFLHCLRGQGRQAQTPSIQRQGVNEETKNVTRPQQPHAQSGYEVMSQETLRKMLHTILGDIFRPHLGTALFAEHAEDLSVPAPRRIAKEPRNFQAEATVEAAKYSQETTVDHETVPTRSRVPLNKRASTRRSANLRGPNSFPDPQDLDATRSRKQSSNEHEFDTHANNSGDRYGRTRYSRSSSSPRAGHAKETQDTARSQKPKREPQVQKPSGYQKPSVQDACTTSEDSEDSEDSEGGILERERFPYAVPEPPAYEYDGKF